MDPGTSIVLSAPAGKFVYVIDAFSGTRSHPAGHVAAFAINPTSGALTAVTGSPFATGDVPMGIAVVRTR